MGQDNKWHHLTLPRNSEGAPTKIVLQTRKLRHSHLAEVTQVIVGRLDTWTCRLCFLCSQPQAYPEHRVSLPVGVSYLSCCCENSRPKASGRGLFWPTVQPSMVVGAGDSQSPLCPVRKQGIMNACALFSCAVWGLNPWNEWYCPQSDCFLHFSQSNNSSLACSKACLLGDSRFCQVGSQYLLVFPECYLHGGRQYGYTLQSLVTRNLECAQNHPTKARYCSACL